MQRCQERVDGAKSGHIGENRLVYSPNSVDEFPFESLAVKKTNDTLYVFVEIQIWCKHLAEHLGITAPVCPRSVFRGQLPAFSGVKIACVSSPSNASAIAYQSSSRWEQGASKGAMDCRSIGSGLVIRPATNNRMYPISFFTRLPQLSLRGGGCLLCSHARVRKLACDNLLMPSSSVVTSTTWCALVSASQSGSERRTQALF